MVIEVDRIFLTNGFIADIKIDDFDTNTDVIVQLKTGEKFIASFITYQNIESIRNENLETGGFLNAKYYWKKNMVLVENCKKNSIEKVINQMIDEGDFSQAFQKLDDN